LVNTPVARRWTSGDGLSLFARDYAGAEGDARLPVICLHGLTRNSRDFEDVAPLIARSGRRVLVPDVRGRGYSDRDPCPDNYVPATYVRDVLQMMDALGIARAVFIGTSMGGIVTMMLAGVRNAAVAAAVLNDVGPEVAPEGIARIKSYVGAGARFADWDNAAAYMATINGPAFPDYDAGDWQRFARRAIREGADGFELDYDPAIAEALQGNRYKAPAFLAWSLYRRLARRRPVLVVRGALSDLLSPAILARMKRNAPSIRTVEVAGVGHAPMLVEPEARTALRQFLEDVA
jgi:pimeloyl-ACP methyl ester carboxylesterase